MGAKLDLAGIKARPSSILIDLRGAGLKQVTWSADPTPKNLAYATLMLIAGAKPAFVSRQMGHANSQMFFKTYSKWLDSDDDWREVEKLSVTNLVTTDRKPA